MAGSERVQNYLLKHKIGALFEDLMAKIISDMPEDPCLYLSRILHLRSERNEGKVSFKKSAEFDSVAVAKRSSYDKPWQTNSKRQTKELPAPSKTVKKPSAPRPEWDHRTKVVQDSSNFEDLWEDSRTSKTQQPGSPNKRPASGWRDGQDGEDVMFSTYGYRGPHKEKKNQNDALGGEFTLMKAPLDKPDAAKQIKFGKKGSRTMSSATHKAHLEQYMRTAETKTDSGYEDDKENDDDNAIELLEDEEDLRREGVINVKKSGVRISRAARRQTPGQPNVRVSICATCTRVLGGGTPSRGVSGAAYDNDYDKTTPRESAMLPKGNFSTVPSDEDEEFESVSQVTGPRRPVWQDSDQELTPRKGKSMLSSNLSPIKGLPMYSTNKSVDTQKKGNKRTNQSEDFFKAVSERTLDTEPVRRTWGPNTEDFSEPQKEKTPTTPKDAGDKKKKDEVSGLENTSSGWHLPPDYDTDSSFYGSPGAQTQRMDRAY